MTTMLATRAPTQSSQPHGMFMSGSRRPARWRPGHHVVQAVAGAAPLPPPLLGDAAAAQPSSSGRSELQPLSPLRFPNSYYDEHGRLVLKNLTLPELEAWCESIGEDGPRRAMQLWRWMYYDCKWIRSLDDAPAPVHHGFSEAFRDKLRPLATLDAGLDLQSVHIAADGTRKMVFKLRNGPAAGGQVETVLIPIVREQGSKGRITLCVSSQVGCAMNCQFCFTGRMGLQGNLTPGQIVEQMVAARRLLYEEDMAAGLARHITPITNVVYMGMGEPMHNLDAVLPSIDVLCQHMGLHLSHNKVTVSTVGLLPEMRRFAASSRAVLAVSLHATTDEIRDWICPVNRRYPLAELIGTLEQLYPRHDKSGHVLIEYTMLRGVNDTLEDAARLLRLTANIRCKVNLIVFNPHPGSMFQPSTPEQVQAFRSVLIQAAPGVCSRAAHLQGGHVATVRDSRGDDEMAACGQLGALPALDSNGAGKQKGLPPLLPPPERLRAVLAAASNAAAV